jgi:hypothetical protein
VVLAGEVVFADRTADPVEDLDRLAIGVQGLLDFSNEAFEDFQSSHGGELRWPTRAKTTSVPAGFGGNRRLVMLLVQ